MDSFHLYTKIKIEFDGPLEEDDEKAFKEYLRRQVEGHLKHTLDVGQPMINEFARYRYAKVNVIIG